MDNIPTDLLRTLVTVVDQRSYTRAAQILGITQPAVSAQIKRLQTFLGQDLFERSGHDINLTNKGAVIVNHARQLLSINDRILSFARPAADRGTIRIGAPTDFVAARMSNVLAEFRERWRHLHFYVRHINLDSALHEIRSGTLDLAMGLSTSDADIQPRHRWSEPIAWLRGPTTHLSPAAPVPLVSFREDCIYYRTAVDILNRSGRESELVLVAPTMVGLEAAVCAGVGVMALARDRIPATRMIPWDDAPLPKFPNLSRAIYIRDGAEQKELEDMADLLAASLVPKHSRAPRVEAVG